MRQILLALALGLMGIAPSAAQSTKVADILARAERSVYGKGATLADFTSVYYDAKGREINRTTGRMYLQGESFRLEYGSIVAVFAGKTLSYHDSRESTLTISEPTAEELLQINPLYFLRSGGKGFAVTQLPESKQAQILSFSPTKQASRKGMEISFLRSSGAPSEVVVKGDDGGRLVISITNIRHQAELPVSQFTLSAKQFPGSEVVDLR